MTDLPPLSAGESLAPGDANDHVLALQQRLAEHGYFHDSPDGVYGESTEAAVRDFQRERGLVDDGTVGEQTWEAAGALTHQAAEHQPQDQHDDPQATGPQTGDLSEDGYWRWTGDDWVPAHQDREAQAEPAQASAEPAPAEAASTEPDSVATDPAGRPGLVSEDGQWIWDGEQWQANSHEELTPELFQEVIAQSMQVNTSGQA